jgi:hypothetical protein
MTAITKFSNVAQLPRVAQVLTAPTVSSAATVKTAAAIKPRWRSLAKSKGTTDGNIKSSKFGHTDRQSYFFIQDDTFQCHHGV